MNDADRVRCTEKEERRGEERRGFRTSDDVFL